MGKNARNSDKQRISKTRPRNLHTQPPCALFDNLQPPCAAAVTTSTVSADASLAITAGQDSILRIWNLKTRTLEKEIGCSSEVTHCVFSGDGRRFITASRDGVVRVWKRPDTEGERSKKREKLSRKEKAKETESKPEDSLESNKKARVRSHLSLSRRKPKPLAMSHLGHADHFPSMHSPAARNSSDEGTLSVIKSINFLS